MLSLLPFLLFFDHVLTSSIPAIRPGIKHAVRRSTGQTQLPLTRQNCNNGIKPKVFIFSMFDSEEEAWYNILDFNILEQNVTVPGFSPLFPHAHCTFEGSVGQMTSGQGEINAAASITAL